MSAVGASGWKRGAQSTEPDKKKGRETKSRGPADADSFQFRDRQTGIPDPTSGGGMQGGGAAGAPQFVQFRPGRLFGGVRLEGLAQGLGGV